jgi:hypothetical protein
MGAENPWWLRYLFLGWASVMKAPWVLIIVGLCFVGLGAYLLGIRSSSKDGNSTSHPTIPLIADAIFEWDGSGPITFRGTFARSGRDLNAYVTYVSAGNAMAYSVTILGRNLSFEPRIKISSIDRFDKNERLALILGSPRAVEGNQQVLKWGKPDSNNISVGITWGHYFGCLIFVDENGDQGSYPFAIISRSRDQQPAPPIIIGPSVLTNCPPSP